MSDPYREGAATQLVVTGSDKLDAMKGRLQRREDDWECHFSLYKKRSWINLYTTGETMDECIDAAFVEFTTLTQAGWTTKR